MTANHDDFTPSERARIHAERNRALLEESRKLIAGDITAAVENAITNKLPQLFKVQLESVLAGMNPAMTVLTLQHLIQETASEREQRRQRAAWLRKLISENLIELSKYLAIQAIRLLLATTVVAGLIQWIISRGGKLTP